MGFKAGEELEAKAKLEACINEIRVWMKANFLKLNDSKTEFLILGSASQLRDVTTSSVRIGDSQIQSSKSARNIGAIFDSSLTMKEHVRAICRACYFHVRNIGKVRKHLTQDAAKTLVHSFIASRVDHMNALLYGIPKYMLSKLQKIQNTAARIVTRTRRRDHITPVLINLHWLPVSQRIEYKVLLTTFKALHDLAPGYIADLVHRYVPPRSTRAGNLSLLTEIPAKYVTFGEKSFKFCAPKLWNKLPHDLRKIDELEVFKGELKTFLFRRAYPD